MTMEFISYRNMTMANNIVSEQINVNSHYVNEQRWKHICASVVRKKVH